MLIDGSRLAWVLTSGSCNGGDQRRGDQRVEIDVGFDEWVVQWWRSVGGEIGGSSFDFAMNFGWMARLGFDFAQRE